MTGTKYARERTGGRGGWSLLRESLLSEASMRAASMISSGIPFAKKSEAVILSFEEGFKGVSGICIYMATTDLTHWFRLAEIS